MQSPLVPLSFSAVSDRKNTFHDPVLIIIIDHSLFAVDALAEFTIVIHYFYLTLHYSLLENALL